MSRLGINTGNSPNDGQGDPLRVAMVKINSNFQEIYNTFGDGNNITGYANTAGISTLARNLTNNPIINVSGILNSGITTTEHLEVINITSTGVVTATQFVGDGSQLTNVTATSPGLEVLDDNVRKGVARELNFGDNIISSGPDGRGRVTISVGSTVAFIAISTNAGYASSAGISTVSGYASSAGISTISGYATTSGIATVAQGLTGNPNINVNQVAISSALTVSGVSTFNNDIHIEYDKFLFVGGNNELQIFHNGSNSYIDNFSGNNLVIRDNGNGIQLRRYGGGPTAGLMANFNTGGGVELYYDSVLKLQTFQNGVAINDSIGIGTTAGNPPYRLTVSGIGATTTANLLNAIADLTSSVDGYGQVNIRNSFAGTNSSGDLIVTANNGTDTTNYIDLGINNSSFNNASWTINGAGDGYLYTSDSNLAVGVASTNKYLSLFVGGTLSANEKVRLTTNNISFSNDIRVTGVVTATSAVIGSAVTITSGGLRSSGIITALSFRPSGGYIQAADGTNSFYIYDSTGNVSFQGTIGASQINNASGNKVIGFAVTDITFENNANVAGILTASVFNGSDFRFKSIAEKTTVISGNTVSLVYNTGGGNIAICTNPTGDITLNVTGIPTDSTFNNYSLTFSVIVSNTGTARSCTTVTLNGVSTTVKWFGGSLAAAISGVTTTTGYDIYNFTGINTVGSASTTANYIVLGSVNGGYR